MLQFCSEQLVRDTATRDPPLDGRPELRLSEFFAAPAGEFAAPPATKAGRASLVV